MFVYHTGGLDIVQQYHVLHLDPRCPMPGCPGWNLEVLLSSLFRTKPVTETSRQCMNCHLHASSFPWMRLPAPPYPHCTRSRRPGSRGPQGAEVEAGRRANQAPSYLPIGWSLLKTKNIKKENNQCWSCGETGTLAHCWWAHKMVQSLWKMVWQCSKQ